MGYRDRRATRFAAIFGTLLLIAQLAVPAARAEGAYAGLGYAQLTSEDVETENLSLVVGTSPDRGLGFEFFYAPTFSEDDISADPFDVEATIDVYGMLVYYKTASDDFNTYLKLKAGMAKVELDFDFGELGSLDDDTSGLTYGFSFGADVGNGALEFSYLVLPEFDDFQGIEIDAEVDMIGIFYLANFD
jgi:hypothetical protein